jgi:hypothetical protein
MRLLQADAINMVRAEIDDSVDGKVINDFSPALGKQDGQNIYFQIPSQRVVIQNFQIFKNRLPLTIVTDYNVTNAKLGQFNYSVAPKPGDEYRFNFTFTWADDLEIDHHLQRAANEMGYYTYHTDQPGSVAGCEVPSDDNGNPLVMTDFPSGLVAALVYGGAYRIASALATRFAMKYDVSAGDKSYSPSQMATAYEATATRLNKSFLNARDDWYKGQGRQFRPSIHTQGFVLPNVTPKR